jgi:putative transposase
MARPLRINAPGLTYHITARGTGRMTIYRDDDDRLAFLDRLAQVVGSYGLECHAYCLMDNHYHLVVTTSGANVSRAVQHLNGPYGQWWNWRHRRVGHVFQGRFGAQIVQDDLYLLVACRYVVLNPVRAGLVPGPADWRWSSYGATAGLTPVPAFLKPEAVWRRLTEGPVTVAAARYREFVAPADPHAVVLPPSHVLGDREFVERFRPWRQRASREILRRERQAKPSLDCLFFGAVRREVRSARAAEAFALGYPMAEIARFLRVHPSTISKMTSGLRRGQTVK